MNCAWKELLSILPPWLAKAADQPGRESLQELRLRLGQVPELNFGDRYEYLQRSVTAEDLTFCVNTATRYSPWAAQTVADGYICAPGGHRIGLCGQAAVHERRITGIRTVSSLCIRIARDFPGCGARAAGLSGSVLLIGPPGSGKTTLLRDIIRRVSEKETVAVVDERSELFPEGLVRGTYRMDILSNCSKSDGIDMVLRTMGPSCIAVDEITAERDCEALCRAAFCGVRLFATAHASSVSDLTRRTVYRPLLKQALFDHVIVLRRDKSWQEERMDL